MSPRGFCVVEYLYRDAANWKTYGEAVLAGDLAAVETARLNTLMAKEATFDPALVGLPSLHEAHWAMYGDDSALDHPFHELVAIRPATTVEASKAIRLSVEAFLARLEQSSERWP